MQQVIFLGLHREIVDLDAIKRDQADGLKLWTMNDFYMFYPWLLPQAIFQVHHPASLPIGKVHGRWGADYREVYNVAGCPVYTCWEDTGWDVKGLDNQVVLDDKLYDYFPRWVFQCTVVYMLATALQQGVQSVRFAGMEFISDGERIGQVPYVMEAIFRAREQGMEVLTDPILEKAWRHIRHDAFSKQTIAVALEERNTIQPYHMWSPDPDWVAAQDIVPYHIKEAAICLKPHHFHPDLPDDLTSDR